MITKRMKRAARAGVLLAGVLMTGSSLLAQGRFSVGIRLGAPGYYAPPPVAVYRPPYPGPGYYWVDGYYDAYGSWFAGYWAAPRYVRPYGYGYGYGYVAPRSYGGYYRRYDRNDDRGRDRDHDGDRERGRGYGNGYRR
jgi:hypothetical protein